MGASGREPAPPFDLLPEDCGQDCETGRPTSLGSCCASYVGKSNHWKNARDNFRAGARVGVDASSLLEQNRNIRFSLAVLENMAPASARILDELRDQITDIEQGGRAQRRVVPFGFAAIDDRMSQGGLALG